MTIKNKEQLELLANQIEDACKKCLGVMTVQSGVKTYTVTKSMVKEYTPDTYLLGLILDTGKMTMPVRRNPVSVAPALEGIALRLEKYHELLQLVFEATEHNRKVLGLRADDTDYRTVSMSDLF